MNWRDVPLGSWNLYQFLIRHGNSKNGTGKLNRYRYGNIGYHLTKRLSVGVIPHRYRYRAFKTWYRHRARNITWSFELKPVPVIPVGMVWSSHPIPYNLIRTSKNWKINRKKTYIICPSGQKETLDMIICSGTNKVIKLFRIQLSRFAENFVTKI